MVIKLYKCRTTKHYGDRREARKKREIEGKSERGRQRLKNDKESVRVKERERHTNTER